jgi:hypothetical protein
VKGKLGRLLFRKIKGRIVPIRISNVRDAIAEQHSYGTKYRKIIAESDKEFMGQLTLEIPKKGNKAYVKDVRVPKEFRRKGISKNLFARAKSFLERYGIGFLRSQDLQHPAQVKIRKKLGGMYKAGAKKKSRSRFFADQFGPWGEETRRVMSKDAIDIIKNNPTGRQVSGTTMLKPTRVRPKKEVFRVAYEDKFTGAKIESPDLTKAEALEWMTRFRKQKPRLKKK